MKRKKVGKGPSRPGAEAARRRTKKSGKPTAKNRVGRGPKIIAPTPEIDTKPKRLNQFIARAGICSRREADELIKEGKIKVNGITVTDFSYRVQADDLVKFGGKTLSRPQHIYILLNKPKDVITTVKDERNRSTVMDLLDKSLSDKGIFPVGRLDRKTLGALILTNDGMLAERLMHPKYRVKKLYLAKSRNGQIEEEDLEKFTKGLESNAELLKVDDVAYADNQKKEIGIMMHHGKNRHIRRMFEVIGHDVSRLERIEYAGLNLKGLRRGKWRNLTMKEVRTVKNLVSLK